MTSIWVHIWNQFLKFLLNFLKNLVVTKKIYQSNFLKIISFGFYSSSVLSSPSLTPDDDVFKHLASTYSLNHARMYLGEPCKVNIE